MSDADVLVELAWRDGVGREDRTRFETAIVADDDPVRPELELFRALCRLACDDPFASPPVPEAGGGAVVHAAGGLVDAMRTGDLSLIDPATATLAAAIAALSADDPRLVPAHAWADLALGGLALLVGDLRVARHRFEAVAHVAAAPVTLRLAAMRRLVGLSVERRDLEAARAWSRKVVALAGSHDRPAEDSHLVRGLLDYAVGDLPAMRQTLAAITDPQHGRIARLLLATSEVGEPAMAGFAEVLRDAVTLDDPLMYALCVLLGARRYQAMGYEADAARTIEAAIWQLRDRAPSLATALLDEQLDWLAEPPAR
jgi:hypothetical protein